MKALGLWRSAGASTGQSGTSCQPATLASQTPTPLWGPRQLLQPHLRSGNGLLRATRREEAHTQRRTLLSAGTAALLTAVPHRPVAPAVATPPQLTVSEPVRLNGSQNGSGSGGDEAGPPECARDCRPANPPLRITAPGRVVAGQQPAVRLQIAGCYTLRAASQPPRSSVVLVHEKSPLVAPSRAVARLPASGGSDTSKCRIALDLGVAAGATTACQSICVGELRCQRKRKPAVLLASLDAHCLQWATSTATSRKPSACSSWPAASRRWTGASSGPAATPP